MTNPEKKKKSCHDSRRCQFVIDPSYIQKHATELPGPVEPVRLLQFWQDHFLPPRVGINY